VEVKFLFLFEKEGFFGATPKVHFDLNDSSKE